MAALLPPPLLRLPMELHRDIIDYIKALEDKVCLRLACRYFMSIIKHPAQEDFLIAETRAFAIENNLYTCKYCGNFRHLLKFADNMRKGKRARHGVDANTRFCVNCGVAHHLYTPGTEVTILGQLYVVCRLCGTFTDQVGAKGACSSCSPAVKSSHKRPTLRHIRDNDDYSDDDWDYTRQLYANGRHFQELYELLPYE